MMPAVHRSERWLRAELSLNAIPRAASPKSRMRSWSELTEMFRLDMDDPKDASDDALWVAERYRRRFGAQALYRKLREAVPDDSVEPGAEHRALRHIAWHTILTLNFDTLIERGLEGQIPGKSILPIVEEEQLAAISRNTLSVVHLHGEIRLPRSIVLTLEHFRKYPTKRPVFFTIARQLL